MTAIQMIFPVRDESSAETDAEKLALISTRARERLTPFSSEVIDFFDELSRDLFPLARTDPAFAPLAFFVRRAHLQQLAEDTRARAMKDTVQVPQGTVLHIPPTNVDTLFLYSLAITLLAGNANVIRISRNAAPATFRIVDIIVNRLTSHPRVAELITILSFDRDQALLDRLSDLCDVRMIWGGDAAIRAIRKSPLRPHAKELTFPDRVSFAAISAAAWEHADVEDRRKIVEGLYNDTFWFDQMACSSPVHLVLVAEERAIGERVGRELSHALAVHASTRYEEVEGQAINKMVDALRGLDRGLSALHWESNTVVTLDGATLQDAVAIRPGGGFFSTQHVRALDEVVPQLERRIQTLSVFGFDKDTLRDFIGSANGAGIDRIVPIGKALDFDAVWDGKDLLMESLRYVSIEG